MDSFTVIRLFSIICPAFVVMYQFWVLRTTGLVFQNSSKWLLQEMKICKCIRLKPRQCIQACAIIQLDLSKPAPLYEICQNEGFLWSVCSSSVFQQNPRIQSEFEHTSGYYNIIVTEKCVLPSSIYCSWHSKKALALCDSIVWL